jgi:hypothetical protein
VVDTIGMTTPSRHVGKAPIPADHGRFQAGGDDAGMTAIGVIADKESVHWVDERFIEGCESHCQLLARSASGTDQRLRR